MGEGLIGLIIMIILLNVAGRVLKILTTGQRRPGDRRPEPPATPRRTAEQQILEELLEFQRERERVSGENGARAEGEASTPAVLEEERISEPGRKPGDLARWSEDAFEKRETAVPYEPQPWREAAHAIEEAAPHPSLSSIESPLESIPRRRDRGSALHPGVRDMLVSPSSLRKAVLLTAILGPCRARRRHR